VYTVYTMVEGASDGTTGFEPAIANTRFDVWIKLEVTRSSLSCRVRTPDMSPVMPIKRVFLKHKVVIIYFPAISTEYFEPKVGRCTTVDAWEPKCTVTWDNNERGSPSKAVAGAKHRTCLTSRLSVIVAHALWKCYYLCCRKPAIIYPI
jgi:hypothetical protein